MQSGAKFHSGCLEVFIERKAFGVVHVGANELRAQGCAFTHDGDIKRGVACRLFVSSQGCFVIAGGFGFGSEFDEFFCQFWVRLHDGEWILRGLPGRRAGLRGQLPTKEQPGEQKRKTRAQGGSKHSHG